MAPKRLEAWLGELVKGELEAVIGWKKATKQGIKIDPECRFSDDGSNLRSSVSDVATPSDVQLVEVKSSADIASIVISDGDLKVEATLSEEARASFEEETGAPITKNVWGDVFRLKRFTVVSTSLGSPYVKIEIDEIEYERLYRTILGDAVALEDEPRALTLREQIKQLRALQLDGGTDLSIWGDGSQAVIKSRGPTMAEDGFEVESGVNLQAPVQAMSSARPDDGHARRKLLALLDGRAPSPTQRSPPSARAPENALSPSKLQAAVPGRSAVVTRTPTPGNTSRGAQSSYPAASAVEALRSPHMKSQGVPPSTQLPAELQSCASGGISSIDVFAYGRRKIPANQRKVLDNPSSWLPSLPGRRFPRPNVPIELLARWNRDAAVVPPDPTLSQRSDVYNSQRPRSRSDVSAKSVNFDGPDSDEPLAEDEWPPTPPPAQARRERPPESSVLTEEPCDPSPTPSPTPSPEQRMPPSSTIGSVIRGTPDDIEVAAPRPLAVRRSPSKQRQGHAPQKSASKTPLTPGSKFNPPSVYDDTMANLPGLDNVASPDRTLSQMQVETAAPKQASAAAASPRPSTRLMVSDTLDSVRKLHPGSNGEGVRYATAQAVTNTLKRPRDEDVPQTSPQQRLSAPTSCAHNLNLAPFSQDEARPTQQKQVPRLSAGTLGASGHSPSLPDSPASRVQSSSQTSPWRPQAASTHVETLASSPSNRHPDEVFRLARQEYFEKARKARREEWLKAHYKPNRGGNLTMANLMARYTSEYPGEREATLEDFMIAAQKAFPTAIITPGMRYQKDSTEAKKAQAVADKAQYAAEAARRAADQKAQHAVEKAQRDAEKKARREEERVALLAQFARIRAEWLQQHYLPHTGKGKLRLRDILSIYKTHHPSDSGISKTDMLDVAQQAWPHADVTVDTLFFSRNAMASPAKPISSQSSTGAAESEHEAVPQPRHNEQADRSARSKQSSKQIMLPRHPPAVSNVVTEDEPLTPLAELCQAYLEIRPGNGSAFSKAGPPKMARRVDVLSWNI